MHYWSWVLSWCRQSLLHRRLRTGLSILEIGIAMALIMSVLGFYRGYHSALARNVERMGYQVLVTAKGCPYEAATLVMRGGVIPMYMEEQVAAEISADEVVKATTRFFLQAEPDPHAERMQLYMGIDDQFLHMKPWVDFQRGSWFRSDRADEVILGYNVADEWRSRLGDTVVVRNRPFTVRGILDRTGTQDDGTVFLPLATAQKLFDRRGKITGVGIRLNDLGDYREFSDRLYRMPSTQVVTMAQVQNMLMDLVGTARWLMTAVAVIGLVIAGIGITNTVLMAVVERLPELGLLRAIGGGRRDIFIFVWGEALCLAFLGAAAGGLLSFAAAGGVEAVLRRILPYTPEGTLIRITGGGLVQAAGVILILGILGGLYPALRAVAVRPMRFIRE